MITDRVYHEDMNVVNARIEKLEDRFQELERLVWKMQVSALIAMISALLSVIGWLWGHPLILPH